MQSSWSNNDIKINILLLVLRTSHNITCICILQDTTLYDNYGQHTVFSTCIISQAESDFRQDGSNTSRVPLNVTHSLWFLNIGSHVFVIKLLCPEAIRVKESSRGSACTTLTLHATREVTARHRLTQRAVDTEHVRQARWLVIAVYSWLDAFG